jgi:hypothetical protein
MAQQPLFTKIMLAEMHVTTNKIHFSKLAHLGAT